MTNEKRQVDEFSAGYEAGASGGSYFAGVLTTACLMINRNQMAITSSLHQPVPPLLKAVVAGSAAYALTFFALISKKDAERNYFQKTQPRTRVILSYESDKQNLEETTAPHNEELSLK